MDEDLRRLVCELAKERCEYCLMPQLAYRFRFPLDHVVARQHGGTTEISNLALACLRCNAHKGPNLAGIDPLFGELTRLFHPRRDRWVDHFQWVGAEFIGLTPIGRTTIAVLSMNDPSVVAVRLTLMEEGVY